ncbi:MAG: hypothetical protein H7245_13145 [Candidatus Saccharibacteria bacterium]|nr:hypothetical protein [Pseudorhodobacter sp.]
MRLRCLLRAATTLTGFFHVTQGRAITFAPVPFAADDAAKRVVISAASALVDGTEVPLSFTALTRSGDMKGAVAFGQLLTRDGKPVADAISNNPDFTSLMPKGDKLYAVTQFEDAPGGRILTELAQGGDGKLSVISSKLIDTSKVGGIWQPSAGSVTAWDSRPGTAWDTHIASEEYPHQARVIEAAKEVTDLQEDTLPIARRFGLDPATMTLDAFRIAFNPYKYGFAIETTVSYAGETTVAKHYATGRLSVEQAYVMPDKKTGCRLLLIASVRQKSNGSTLSIPTTALSKPGSTMGLRSRTSSRLQTSPPTAPAPKASQGPTQMATSNA